MNEKVLGRACKRVNLCVKNLLLTKIWPSMYRTQLATQWDVEIRS